MSSLCSMDDLLDRASGACKVIKPIGDAQLFRRTCSLHSVQKTCVHSGVLHSWSDKSYGLSWVAVHSTDNSVCVVARIADLDTARVGPFHNTRTKLEVMYALNKAIVSEVEGFPYYLYTRFGLIIKKPFGVVSVCPSAKQSGEEHAKCDKYNGINFLTEKVKEPVVTVDDAIKTAISSFKCLFPRMFKAEEYLVTALDGSCSMVKYLSVPETEKHLAVIDSGWAWQQQSMSSFQT